MAELKLDSRKRKRVKDCPCGKSNKDGKFVPYVGHDKKGYCHSCGETFLPKMDRENFIPQFSKPKQTDYLDYELIIRHGRDYGNNHFIQFLKKRFGQVATEAVILAYSLGTSDKWLGSTIFWQIDNENRVRTGKVMLYDPLTGKNVKEPFRHVFWVHSEGYSLSQCLFGLHLVTKHQPDIIALVESEKTAVIMALTYPEENITWLATGGKGNFRRDLLKPIRNNYIIAYPDKGEYNQWLAMASELNGEGYNIKVDDTLEGLSHDKGTDWADIVLEESRVLSEADNNVKKMSEINPALLQLIDEFDLVDTNGNDILL